MLEPLTASAVNTFFHSTRPIALHRLSVLTMAAVSTSFPSEFFTPAPRKLKGKERAQPEFGGLNLEASAAEHWSGLTHGFEKPSRLQIACRSVDSAPARSRTRRSHSQRLKPPLPLYTWLHGPDRPQRRHASNTSLAPRIVPTTFPPTHSATTSTSFNPATRLETDAEGLSPSQRRRDILGSRESCWNYIRAQANKRADMSTDEMDIAWIASQRVRAVDDLTSPTATYLLSLMARLVSAMAVTVKDVDWKQWCTRIRSFLHELEPHIRSTHRLLWQSCLTQTHAYSGNFKDALAQLDILEGAASRQAPSVAAEYTQLDNVLRTYNGLLVAMNAYHGSPAVLEFISRRWNVIGLYLKREALANYHVYIVYSHKTLRTTASQIILSLARPSETFSMLGKQWSAGERTEIGQYIVDVLSQETDHVEDAFAFMKDMYDQGLEPSVYYRTVLIKGLAKAGKKQLSTELFVSLYKECEASGGLPDDILTCGLYTFAVQGDVERAETFFNQLKERNTLGPSHIANMLHVHALCADYTRAEEVFQEYCVQPSEPRAIIAPSIFHWTPLLLAYAEARDSAGMNTCLKRMLDAGIKADQHVYNIILESLIRLDNLDDILALLQQMRNAGYPPSRVAYTTLLAFAARKKDAQAADAVYKRAMAEGIKPDRTMFNALLNAHVEAGSWRGAILAFDYIKNSGLRIGIDTWTSLLKAYVFIGAPFRVVSALFTKLEEVGIEPHHRAYALVIQSACDAGRMRTAAALLREVDRRAKEWPSDFEVSVHILTIIMAGYLRLKDKVRAKAVFDDMRTRNIDPTSVTYAIILNAYGNEKTLPSIQAAEDFLSSLLEEEETKQGWLLPDGGRAKALENVFYPVLTAWARKARPTETERVYEQMLDHGGKPTLGTMTALMDSYRRTRNIQEVQNLWAQIVELGENLSSELDPFFAEEDLPNPPGRRRHSNILCIPFSIYVDALSSGGYHPDVAVAWGQLQSKGFTLDSHNWNHLAVALVRAGEPERAFEILERVILRHRKDTLTPSPRDTKPDSPVIADLREEFVETRDIPHYESEMHIVRERAARAGLIGKKVRPWMTDMSHGDFAHPLHILHTVSPGWNIWRPHNATLHLLGRTLAHLHAGNVVQPLRPGQTTEIAAFESRITSVEELEERREQARATLKRIYDNYPEAAATVLEWERWNAERHPRLSHKPQVRIRTKRR